MGVGCLVWGSNNRCHFDCHLKSIKLQKYKVVVCTIILSTTCSNANITLSLNWTSRSIDFSINTNHWRTYQQQGHRRRKCLLSIYASILQGWHFGNSSQARRIKLLMYVNVGEENWSKNIILKNPPNTSHIVIYKYYISGNSRLLIYICFWFIKCNVGVVRWLAV